VTGRRAPWLGAAWLGATVLLRASFGARAGSARFYLLAVRQRDASGGVLAPAVTHVTWSVLMLRCLPPLFREAGRPPRPGSGAPHGHRP